MFEPPFVMAALVPGALIGAAVLAIFHGGHVPGPISPPSRSKRIGSARRRLATQIERAGWNESPERVAVLAIVLSAGLAAVGLGTAVVLDGATAISLAAAGAATGAGAVLYSLRAAATRRRRRVTRELAPLLELFVLELSGGGSALSALGSVTMQLDGELSLELRRLLIASQVSG